MAATGSPFNREIREVKLPEGFKLLAMKSYIGKSDPLDHLDHFNDLMQLHLVSEMAKCRSFAVTLTSNAKNWLRAMHARLISSW